LTVRLRETTRSWVADVRVGVGSVIVDDYVDAAGAPRRGWVAALVLPEQPGEFVGAGSVVVIGAAPWRVVSVEKDGDALGVVTLEAVGA
jgi:hypothetical protein